MDSVHENHHHDARRKVTHMPTEESKPAGTEVHNKVAVEEMPKPAVSSDATATAFKKEEPAKKGAPTKRIIFAVVAAVILGFGIPWVLHSLHTVSTDDAYVNSYVTFTAPRVAGQVKEVLVEDNQRVAKGQVLVELDPEPYKVQVAIQQAAVDVAETNVVVAQMTVRGQVALARSLRFKLQHTIEDVDNQVAALRTRAAVLDQSKASLVLAQSEFDRAKKLLEGKVASPEEYDRAQETLAIAKAQVAQSLESVGQARVALGLPREPAPGAKITDVPEDLDQNFSAVRQALAELMQAAAQLGVASSSFDITPKQVLEEFYKRDPGGDIDKIYAALMEKAPALKQAQAKLEEARRDLEKARLDLRYCTIRAEIDGVVTRRNVNPGNHVQVGQSLMAIRSLRDIWVDANFKETQLRHLRIGQKVKLKVDMYGGKKVFEGRVSGFTMGTGSTLSLLPAQNATGNFVKVVQRLPVRIDVVNYHPDDAVLFVGLSVEPEVDIQSAPEGPNAGKYLQDLLQPSAPAKSEEQKKTTANP
jgi:membrane fusion protein (multidrug efflux system)